MQYSTEGCRRGNHECSRDDFASRHARSELRDMLMLEPMKALISGASVAVICVLAVAFMPVVMILMPAWLVLQRVAGPVQEKSERNPKDEAWALAWVVTKAELARSMAPYKRDW